MLTKDEPAVSRDDKMIIYFEPSGYAYETVGKGIPRPPQSKKNSGQVRAQGRASRAPGEGQAAGVKGKSKEPP